MARATDERARPEYPQTGSATADQAGQGQERPRSSGDWRATLKRTFAELRAANRTDDAAALTYYGVLSIFPTLLALVALVGVLGRYPQTVESVMGMLKHVAPSSTVKTLEGTLDGIVRNKGGAGALLGVGIVGALWSASGYVGALSRAANRIYGVAETRPFWKLRPLQVMIARS